MMLTLSCLKNNLPTDKIGGGMEVFTDQLYSPKVSEARQEALKNDGKSSRNTQTGVFS